MSEIWIGNSERPFCDASESWIEQQVHERRADGQQVCARVVLKAPAVDVVLSTPNCAQGQGGGRLPNEKELEIFGIWDREHLNDASWTARDLISFVRRVRHLICQR